MNDEDYNLWGRDPVSAEIDSQVRAMPDRPQFILAIISFNKSPEQAKFRALGPFQKYFLRDVGYDCFNQKVTVAFFGFEIEDLSALAGSICALAAMNLDEAALYIAGDFSLRITKPRIVKPESEDEPS